jgi:hypothetical protein
MAQEQTPEQQPRDASNGLLAGPVVDALERDPLPLLWWGGLTVASRLGEQVEQPSWRLGDPSV